MHATYAMSLKVDLQSFSRFLLPLFSGLLPALHICALLAGTRRDSIVT
jgi:hypothetical protein